MENNLSTKTLFKQKGIKFNLEVEGHTSLYYLENCPLCKNGSVDHPNRDCFLVESPTNNGKNKLEYRCFHDDTLEGFHSSEKIFDSLGVNPQPLPNLTNSNNNPGPKRASQISTITPKNEKNKTHSEYNLRLFNSLTKNLKAMDWLRKEHFLTPKTLQYFGIGLSQRYLDTKTKTPHQDALVFPLAGDDGELKSYLTYINIPGLTLNPISDVWSANKPSTYYSRKHRGRPDVLIFESVMDLWSAYQFLLDNGHEEDYILIASTHPDSLPAEWASDFFTKFKRIYICPSKQTSDFEKRIANIANCEIRFIHYPDAVTSWAEYFNSIIEVQLFFTLIDNSEVVNISLSKNHELVIAENLFPFNPIDCNGAFHNGHLYYPALFLEKETVLDNSGNPKIAEKTKVVLIRSDRTVQYVKKQSLQGKTNSNPVIRLTDDTLIRREPEVSENLTWTFESISKYLKHSNVDRSLSDMILQMRQHLASSVWLPSEDDYTLLALTAAVSYCMTIFNSVPLILLTGEKGTGKTELSESLISISANAQMIGQGSAAAVAREIDRTRGLAVLDDQDQLGNKRKGDSKSEYLLQMIKQSYSKKSANKVVSIGSTVKRLNFYGIKVINNTTGIDPITGSRCLHIYTALLPVLQKSNFLKMNLNKLDEDVLSDLRDDMHTWVFCNTDKIHEVYLKNITSVTNRTEEIHAPLRTFAKLAGDEKIIASLERALTRQVAIISCPDKEPDEMLTSILSNLIIRGYRSVTPTHIHLELLLDKQRNISTSSNRLDNNYSPEWIGRKLRSQELILTKTQTRKTIRGHKLRVLEISPELINTVIPGENLSPDEKQIDVSATGFCQYSVANSCQGCRYSGIDCLLNR